MLYEANAGAEGGLLKVEASSFALIDAVSLRTTLRTGLPASPEALSALTATRTSRR